MNGEKHSPAQFEVTIVVEGAVDAIESFADEDEAQRFADAELELCRQAGVPAEAHIVPHYCQGDTLCSCVQWLTDHHPYGSV